MATPNLKRRSKQLLRTALSAVTALVIGAALLYPSQARASGGLGLALKIQQEFYKPLVPVTRNFKTCFKTDPNTGAQIMGICTETPAPGTEQNQPQRLPATGTRVSTPPGS